MISDVGMYKGVGGIIHKVCRDFRNNEIEPVALELDSHYDPERIKAIWVKSSELELPSMLIPEEYGGVDQNIFTAAQVLEELAFGCAGVATLFAHHLAACIPLIEACGAQEELLRLIASSSDKEPVMATIAYPGLEEREDELRLEKSEGAFSLSGRAPLVGCASLADYIILVLDEDGRISMVVVDTSSKGVSVEGSEEMLGLHTLPFCDVAFSGCELGEANIIGEIGEAAPVWHKTQAAFNGFIAAIAMGTARSACVKAHRYAQERYQFGKTIIEHHEIRRFLANMMIKLYMGTAGYNRALSGETLQSPLPFRAGDMVRIFCTDAALEIAIDAVQVHGGYGYMKETGLEKIMRDTKMLQLLGKSNRLMEIEMARP